MRCTIGGALLLVLPLLASTAVAQDGLGLKVGLNYSVLGQPADAPGDITFLDGSAMSGVGLTVGVTYVWRHFRPVVVETGLVYSHATAIGSQTHGDKQREVEIAADTLRFPVWLKYAAEVGPVRGTLGVGPELVVGVTSAAEVREVNILERDAAVIETLSVTALHLTGVLGIEFSLGGVNPGLALHASVNPFTGQKTTDRFQAVKEGVPSQLRAEFDYELLVLLGVSYDL
jgi:hypothetical protein